jgi:hypothetical protein
MTAFIPYLIAWAALATIAAMIAARKGRKAPLWWAYGFSIPPLAIWHALMLEGEGRETPPLLPQQERARTAAVLLVLTVFPFAFILTLMAIRSAISQM